MLCYLDVENLKKDGRFYHAGALAYALGAELYYGCHYGMRSTRDAAMAMFEAGYTTARLDMRQHGAAAWSR